ncbi:hypothetical protein [Iodidimonas sp. SYSU 1G8]|uniref:hypothetical protein n=1 Tax=Iodidimonas sp. SYSU 1G8 TaxID=3133967 RepID=UPI0031FE4CE4
MKAVQSWLADIVVVNESAVLAEPGDVSVFRSEGEACAKLEHWWVENDEGGAFDATGRRMILAVDSNQRVVVAERLSSPDGPDIVHGWLTAHAHAVLASRGAKALLGQAVLAGFEERGELPSSVEGLIAYVGFDR